MASPDLKGNANELTIFITVQISASDTYGGSIEQYEPNKDSGNGGTAINEQENNFTELCENEFRDINNPEIDIPTQESNSTEFKTVLNHCWTIGFDICRAESNGAYLQLCLTSVIKESYASEVSDSNTSGDSMGENEPNIDSLNEGTVINKQEMNFTVLYDTIDIECRDLYNPGMDIPKQETKSGECNTELCISGTTSFDSCNTMSNGTYIQSRLNSMANERYAAQMSDSDTSGASTRKYEPSIDSGNEGTVFIKQKNFPEFYVTTENECRDMNMDMPRGETIWKKLDDGFNVAGRVGSLRSIARFSCFYSVCCPYLLGYSAQISDSCTSGASTGLYQPNNDSGNKLQFKNWRKANFNELCDTTENDLRNVIKAEVDMPTMDKNFMESSDASEDECLDGNRLTNSILTLVAFIGLNEPNQHNDNEQINIYNHGKNAFRLSDVFENTCRAVSKPGKDIYKLSYILLKILLTFFMLTSVDCRLEPINQNTAVIYGNGTVLFKCKSDEGYKLKWLMQQSSISERLVLFDGYIMSNGAESFSHVENGEPGKFYLNLTATYEAAKTFICQEPDTHNEISADLIILNETKFEKEVSDGLVIITCVVEFRGNWAPELEWSYNGTSIDEKANTTTVPNKMVSSTLVLLPSAVERNFTCSTKFDITGKPEKTSSINVPDYISSSKLTVEANKMHSGKDEGQSSVNGASTIFVIGIVVGVISVFFVAELATIILYKRHQRKTAKKLRKEAQRMTDSF